MVLILTALFNNMLILTVRFKPFFKIPLIYFYYLVSGIGSREMKLIKLQDRLASYGIGVCFAFLNASDYCMTRNLALKFFCQNFLPQI